MAHIANCLASHELGSAPKAASPALSLLSTTPPTNPSDKPFTWRMLHSESQRKYQLFPKQTPAPISKTVDYEKIYSQSMNLTEQQKTDKPSTGTTLKNRINQHNLVRRRKVSVPELGPMTTVQEVPMDSPTIPGRPPLHERSASAPEDRTQQPSITQATLRTICDDGDDFVRAIEEAMSPDTFKPPRPFEPRQLAPLVIPDSISYSAINKPKYSYGQLRSETPPLDSSRSGRMDSSPMSRGRWTPGSSTPDLMYPRSATTDGMSATTLPTPISAPIMEAYRASPRPWEGSSAGSERAMTPQSDDSPRSGPVYAHRRGASESSSVMDRGRPRKRNDPRRTAQKSGENMSSNSLERKAFEELPKGWKPSDAMEHLSKADMETLQRQAFGQAERFEVLRIEDVECLSKELRHLDERTEYLRRTYTSLRAGRRNLHSRICQYLRSPRVARFSHESMLKQEEALAELDASIDDWVIKLEQAENRRTRVRQKLLEHVAAATILPIPGDMAAADTIDALQQSMNMQSPLPRDISTPPRSPVKASFTSVHTVSSSPSPQRVVAQVPSTILEQPLIEEAATRGDLSRSASTKTTLTLRRGDVESIRIYAGDDLYTLLADVENEISRMSQHVSEEVAAAAMASAAASAPALPTLPASFFQNASEPSHKERERQRSHERLAGKEDTTTTTTTTARVQTPPTPSTGFAIPRKEIKPLQLVSAPKSAPPPPPPPMESPILLTSAVFRP